MVQTSPEPPRLNDTPCTDPADMNEGTASSDSEDEAVNYDGYELLPTQTEEDDIAVREEFPSNIITNNIEAPGVNHCAGFPFLPNGDPLRAEREERVQLWSGRGGRDVHMDEARTQQVLQAMAGFSLPSSAVPDWASNVPEGQWRARLDERLQVLNRPSTSTDPK